MFLKWEEDQGTEGERRKRMRRSIRMCYVQAPTPHKECKYHARQICTTRKLDGTTSPDFFLSSFSQVLLVSFVSLGTLGWNMKFYVICHVFLKLDLYLGPSVKNTEISRMLKQ